MGPSSIFSLITLILAVLALAVLANVTYQVWRLLRLKVQQNEFRLATMKEEYEKRGDSRD
jgi:Tfp pilus assembly protein PilE